MIGSRFAAVIAFVLLVVPATSGCSDAPDPSALASSSSREPATIWAVGDGASGSSAGRAVAARIAQAKPDRFLYLGDVYEQGTALEYARNYAYSFGRLAGRTAPTPGNHEWPLHTEGYDDYWGAVMGKRVPYWYRFSLGGWELLSLNSEAPHDPASPQLRWLRSRLRGGGNCRLAFWHRPRFSAGQHGDAPDLDPIWNAVRRRVALVVNGHEHNMQRLEPRDGITTLIAGAGGHSHYPLDSRDRRLAFWNVSHYGALRLELQPGLAEYAFVSVDGRKLDSGRVPCKAAGT